MNDPQQPYQYQPPAALPYGQKPGLVTTIGVMTLVNGILNILYGLGITAAIVLGTIGIGLLCAPVTILPCVLGVFEILYGANILANPPKPGKANMTLAILEIVAVITGNMISLVVGILNLVFFNDAQVKAYFDSTNVQQY